jgi:hypothetical protein
MYLTIVGVGIFLMVGQEQMTKILLIIKIKGGNTFNKLWKN